MSHKVLHIINGEFYAGAERVQDLLAINLPQFGYDIGFACLKTGVFNSQRKAIDAALHPFPMASFTDLSVVVPISKTIKKHEYHLIHTHTPRTAMIGQLVSFITGVPMLHHVHGPTNADTESVWRNRRNALLERFSVARARFFIPVSAHARDYAQTIGASPYKVRMVWNGVPTSTHAHQNERNQPIVIGTAALFRPKKGIEVLLKALAQLQQSDQRPVTLNMIGSFETAAYEKSIKQLAYELGIFKQINWIGFSNDIYGELKKLSLFVLPSLYGEGMPMVILEAMAMGLPIVSTRVGGIEEAITHGQHGLLVTPEDAAALADALAGVITGHIDGRMLGDNARARQIEFFSDRSMAQGVAKVYDEALPKL